MSHLFIEPNDPSRERGDGRSPDDHISGPRLAALADERPTSEEQQHLARCPECAREVEAHRSLLSLAESERDSMGIPLTRWNTLSERLREEGLITSVDRGSVTAEWASPIKSRYSTRALLRVAAALMLVASGAVIGRASTGASVLPGGLDGTLTQGTARAPFTDAVPTAFASVDEARRAMEFYAGQYQSAVSFLAQNDSSSSETPAVMRTRLSALDRVQRTMGEALKAAPYDPVINGFYLSSFGQREATLRQLNTVLPEGVRLNSF
jgi:anti-sigma factor RsiW